MSKKDSIPQPILIVVTGRPGSGKSTLSPALAEAIRCPILSRDAMKEGFLNTIGPHPRGPDDAALKVYKAFFDAIRLLLERGITHIAEAAFQHKLWAPRLEALRESARVRVIVCSIDPALAHQRHCSRGQADPLRQRFHPLPVGPDDAYDPPRLDVPTLHVDTTGRYQPDLAAIVAFARG